MTKTSRIEHHYKLKIISGVCANQLAFQENCCEFQCLLASCPNGHSTPLPLSCYGILKVISSSYASVSISGQ